jgi:hypothetical protein
VGLGKLLGDEAELLRGLWWSRARRNGGSTVRPRELARRRKGVAALGVWWPARVRVRTLGSGDSLCRAARLPWRAGPD